MRNRKVQCWIFSKDKAEPQCLILKTHAGRGSFWQPVTGTVEPNEGYYEAACREPIEETSFNFLTPPVNVGYEFEFTSQFGVTREHVFALEVDQKPVPVLDPKEHEDFQWTSPQNALKLLKYSSNIEGLKHAYKLYFGRDLET